MHVILCSVRDADMSPLTALLQNGITHKISKITSQYFGFINYNLYYSICNSFNDNTTNFIFNPKCKPSDTPDCDWHVTSQIPVKYRIEFKTPLLVFKGLRGMAPSYIKEMLIPSKIKRYSMRSSDECLLRVPKIKHSTFGGRTFAVCGPRAWSSLPSELRKCEEIYAFKRSLKTHLFVKFVNESYLVICKHVKRPRMLSAQLVALYNLVNLNLKLANMYIWVGARTYQI